LCIFSYSWNAAIGGDKHQSINQSINSNQAYQQSITGKDWERSLIKPDLKPIFVNSYRTEQKATCVIKYKHKTFVDYL